MTTEQLQDKCRGSLVGGAVGDALGYEVEFMSLPSIRKRFGQTGITDYVTAPSGVAEFSDDTQMTLFTAEGLLSGIAEGRLADDDLLPYISTAYQHWYYTQMRPMQKSSGSWLSNITALWARRAPGNTCMTALRTLTTPGSGPVHNNSKGCGGVMRVAPIGIFSATHPEVLNLERAGDLAGFAADLTHKHPLSTYSSMALAMIVAECMADESIDRAKFRFIVLERVFGLLGLRFKGDEHLAQLRNLVVRALRYAESAMSDTDAIAGLGEGWVGEEALAIALFSVMRHIDRFERCIISAVNHDGDSDSTGAIAGNIIGAILGYQAIPQKYLRDLELHDLVLSVADDLGGFSSPEQIAERYLNHHPVNINAAYLLDR